MWEIFRVRIVQLEVDRIGVVPMEASNIYIYCKVGQNIIALSTSFMLLKLLLFYYLKKQLIAICV